MAPALFLQGGSGNHQRYILCYSSGQIMLFLTTNNVAKIDLNILQTEHYSSGHRCTVQENIHYITLCQSGHMLSNEYAV
jgi:hypothetical protein